ncbi:MAG: SDR family NAD(P)-dependent oxidoreductase [bacterium]|nr:SDR family NAD(P)-dependent oxidoreductase [bacterium]
MATKSILITGANGFIGSRLCLTFLRQGFRVIAGIRQNCDRRLLDGLAVTYRYGDVTDPASLAAMVAEVDYVIHNAGVVKSKNRDGFFHVNGQGTANLMAAVARNNPNVTRVVYVSSQAVSGPSINGRPVAESDEPHPVTTYGESKRAGEEATTAYKDQLNVVIVRPSAVYGPGDKEAFSFFKLANMRLRVYFGDVTRKVQMVHVDDLCAGISLATLKETRSGSIYHLAEKQAYTIKDLVDQMKDAVGKKAMTISVSGSLFRRIAAISERGARLVGATPMLTVEKCNELLDSWEVDVRKAKEDLGFESTIPFAQGAAETYSWYKEHGWL